MSDRLKNLIDQRASAWETAQDIRARLEADKREINEDEDKAYTSALDDVEKLSKQIADEERAVRLEAVDYRAVIAGDELKETEGRSGVATDEYRKAFANWMRGGERGLEADQIRMLQAFGPEARDNSAGTNSAGGYTVPTDFLAKITETLKAYGGIMGISNVLYTSNGRTLPWPSNDDTSNVGALISENTADTNQDLVFAQKSLSAFTYTSKAIKLSLELLQDTDFDLESFVGKKCGQRLGRIVSTHLATGDGSSKPTGIANAPTVGKTGLTGQTTSVIYDDLIDLIHSIDVAYRNSGTCRFAMADTSLATVRKLKDSQGHPLWQPSIQAGVPDTLLSYAVTVDNGMPTMAANALPILFGDFTEGYIVRVARDVELVTLRERWADQRQVGYFGFMRVDAKPDDTSAIKAYKNSAT